MIPSITLTFVLFVTTNLPPILSKSVVIEVKGDCAILGKKIADEHGYRYVRQVCFYWILLVKLKWN